MGNANERGAHLTSTSRDEITTAVKEIIVSIKPIDLEAADIPDDAPLFSDGAGEASPVGMDSLDMLDLAFAIGEKFGLNQEQFDGLVGGDSDLTRLRTVNDIADFIRAFAPNSARGVAA
jgi:acyl carrier protein